MSKKTIALVMTVISLFSLGMLIGEVAIAIRCIRQRAQNTARPPRSYLHDMAVVAAGNGTQCASCGGTATQLAADPETRRLICEDRATCTQTVIWRTLMGI